MPHDRRTRQGRQSRTYGTIPSVRVLPAICRPPDPQPPFHGVVVKIAAVVACALMARSLVAQPVPSAKPARMTLRAGTSRIDYTPRGAALPSNFTGVLDPVFVRTLVLDDGRTRAALVSIDAGATPAELYEKVSARAAQELGIPATQLLISASHTHSVPFRFDTSTITVVLRSLREAAGRLRPAQVAWGTGEAHINVNRDRVDPRTNRWWEGPNYQGNSDKTVAVMHVRTPDGKPLATYYNYAVHNVITGTLDMISGDITGAASRYIEESLGDGAIAMFSSGAAGDQNPIYFNQTYELRDLRIADYARRGQDISNAMPPGGQGMDRSNPRVMLLMDQQKRVNESLGLMLGEEVLHVVREGLEKPVAEPVLAGTQGTFACPARQRTDSGRAGYAGTYVDAGDVSLMLTALRIGDIYIGGVNGEVYSGIAQRLKRESPYKHTLMATLTNGMAGTGYIPSDDAYGRNVFTVLSTRLKPGCAEAGIVTRLVDAMRGLTGPTGLQPS